MDDLALQPQASQPWMQMPNVQFPQKQQHGYGDLAGALVGRGVKAMQNKNQMPGKKMFDSPMPNNPLPMVGALAGLPMSA